MNKIEQYRQTLAALPDWKHFLLDESGLPGPRANLALVEAAADLASPQQVEALLADGANAAENTPQVFLAVCGTVALGRLLVEGQQKALPRLRQMANDHRWRIRESVAMALQRYGDADMEKLVEGICPWASGTLLEQRALIAALCEPRLLVNPRFARITLELLDQVTHNLCAASDRKSEGFQALRKGLAYAWSVAVAALPDEGKQHFERWVKSNDKDVQWVVRENLKKNRLIKMDITWVEQQRTYV